MDKDAHMEPEVEDEKVGKEETRGGDAQPDPEKEPSQPDDTSNLQKEVSSTTARSPQKAPELLPVSEETITSLSRAFIQAFQPHFEHSKESLHELIRNQELLLDTVQQENRKYEENEMIEDVNETMKKARLYQTKLVNIRKEMVHLHDRVGKLKKRALKLQNQRMKENLQREQQKEREYEEDRLLKARPASSSLPGDGNNSGGS